MTTGWVEYRMGGFVLETSWEAEPGEVLVLFGPSGAGKTTTLRAIAGLAHPDRGRIEVGQQLVYESGSRTWVPPHRRRVGYMTQEYHLFPHLTVRENIGYGLGGKPASEKAEAVGALLDSLRLADLAERRTWELSGGQAQRVALARALSVSPAVLLLDEPFSSLDGELRRTLRGEIRGVLGRANIPVIMVTHDREEALALGDTVQVIDGGRTLERGNPLEVLGQPGQGRLARLVGVENVLPMRVAARYPRDGTMECVARDGPVDPSERFRLEAPISDFDEGEGHGGPAGVGRYPGGGAAGELVGAEPGAGNGDRSGAASPGLPGDAGLRRSRPAMPHHWKLADGDGNPSGAGVVGGVQGVVLLPG